MTVTKALWAALSGCLTVIVLMASAWAHDTNERGAEFDRRININEQHYATIEAELNDLRDHFKELNTMIREDRAERRLRSGR